MSNEYRVRDGFVEFRSAHGRWRMLSESDLRLHFRFDTEVARWLRRQLSKAVPDWEDGDRRAQPIYSAAAVLDFFFDFPPR